VEDTVEGKAGRDTAYLFEETDFNADEELFDNNDVGGEENENLAEANEAENNALVQQDEDYGDE
jgi:hypothetical protein